MQFTILADQTLEGGEDMNQAIRHRLVGILDSLARSWQNAVAPCNARFELTPRQYGYRYVVPDRPGKQGIAFADYFVRCSPTHNKNEPCAIIAVDASLLNDKDAAYKLSYFPKANWGNTGEVHIAVCRIGDSDYRLALRALVEATRSLLSGTRYTWKGIKK